MDWNHHQCCPLASQDINCGRLWHPPSWFMPWAPVFLMAMASHMSRLVVSLSLLGNFTPQSMVWLFLATWSVMAEGCNSRTKSFFLARVNFTSANNLTSLLCSFPLTPYLLSVSPVYTQGQSLHGTWYTIPAFSGGVLLSLGCTSILLRVKWDFMVVATP